MSESGHTLGIVAIGRNEGDRLKACLASLLQATGSSTSEQARLPIVYVDSGSSDGSVAHARSVGVEVVELDMTLPFSAARARNAGLARLLELEPKLKYVQFLDGDCLLVPGWLDNAVEFLESHADFAVACGRVRERFPEASVYNRLLDLEWDTPVGEAKACGGISMMRVSAFGEVGGFNPAVVAGEEPELCVRLRARGWRVMRLDADMTLHDAAMTRFGQWWKRSVRGGYAYALGAAMHGHGPEKHKQKQIRSIVFWVMVLPGLALIPGYWTSGWSLLLLLLYLLQMLRVMRQRRQRGSSLRDAGWYGFFCVLAKFPEAMGCLRFLLHHFFQRSGSLIEYKSRQPGQAPGESIPKTGTAAQSTP